MVLQCEEVWPKWLGLGIIAIYLIALVVDAFKTAKANGGSWKRMLVRVILLLVGLATLIAINVLINRQWAPGKVLFRIGF